MCSIRVRSSRRTGTAASAACARSAAWEGSCPGGAAARSCSVNCVTTSRRRASMSLLSGGQGWQYCPVAAMSSKICSAERRQEGRGGEGEAGVWRAGCKAASAFEVGKCRTGSLLQQKANKTSTHLSVEIIDAAVEACRGRREGDREMQVALERGGRASGVAAMQGRFLQNQQQRSLDKILGSTHLLQELQSAERRCGAASAKKLLSN